MQNRSFGLVVQWDESYDEAGNSMRNLWLSFVLALTTAALATQQPPDLIGVWQASMLVEEGELAKQSKEFQGLMRAQVAKFQKKPWQVTLRKDGTYLLP